MTPDQYNVLSEKIDSVQKSVDRIDRDLAHDREELQHLTIRVGTLEAEVNEMRKLVTNLPKKTQDKVEDILEPVSKEVKNLTTTIKNKKILTLTKKAKSFWKFWAWRK